MDEFTLTYWQAREEIMNALASGITPMLTSSPGMGKSAMYYSIAEECYLELIDCRISQLPPEDLCGLPMRVTVNGQTKATYATFDMFPTPDTPLPPGKKGWLLLLDEFNSGSRATTAASYKLIFDRMVGQTPLHPNVFIAAAGNLETDNAIVNPQGTAVQSRLVHYTLGLDFEAFMDNAIKKGYDSRILGFLNFQPDLLHKFDPDHQDKTFPCPRTWEFASKLIARTKTEDVTVYRLASAVGSAAAVSCHTFLREFANLPTYNQILTNPEDTDMPSNPATKWALVSMLFNKPIDQDFETILPYVNRMDSEFRALFVRGIIRKWPELRRNSKFMNFSKDLMRYFKNDPNFTSNEVAA